MSNKILLAVLILVLFFLGGVYFLLAQFLEAPSPTETPKQILRPVASAGEYPNLASKLADRINSISPTPPVSRDEWIAQRISFVAGSSHAYIEYTDTHVALKLLLEYYYQDAKLKTLVLATFVPNENGWWDLQFGQDTVVGKPVAILIFDQDINQWFPEESLKDK